MALQLCNICFCWGSVFLLVLSSTFSCGGESDINCLKSIKESLEDPLDMLTSSWDFNNATEEGFICNFLGIECWKYGENKVLNIMLSDLGLSGQFPRGIADCKSLTGLDLSGNKLSGSIPEDISRIMPYITSLDLSNNSFSGTIPASLFNCTFLNVLKLDNNRLSGQIPREIGQLSRIKAFSVANNLLRGPVPDFVSIPEDSYANNTGLCGGPLKSCRSSFLNKSFKNLVRVFESNTLVMMGAAGFGIGFVFSFSFFIFQ